MNVNETAEMLGVSRITIWRLTKDGLLSVVKIGSRTLVRQSECEAFMDRNEITFRHGSAQVGTKHSASPDPLGVQGSARDRCDHGFEAADRTRGP